MTLFGVEFESSPGAEEKYHDPLRRLYDKILISIPSISTECTLDFSVRGHERNNELQMSRTNVSRRWIRTETNNVCHVCQTSVPSTLPDQQDRMNAMSLLKGEMDTITSQVRLQKALTENMTSADQQVLKPNDDVLVYQEKEKKNMVRSLVYYPF